MANELDLYGPGDLAPYSPSQPLAPAPAPDWQHVNTDLLPTDYHTTGGTQPMVFGQPLPPGVSIEQVMQAYNQLGGVFCADFLKLGHNITHPQKAVKWFLDAITNPPAKQTPRHSYNLYEHANDPLFQAFANYAADNGFSAKFVQDACWWVSEAGRKLAQRAQTPVGDTPAQGRAPNSDDPTDELTNAEFEAVVKANEAAKAKTYVYLENLWGQSYQANMKMVDAYFQSLPLHEQRALDVFTTGWIKALNTKEVILGLYKQAIGSATLPSGAALAAEIAQHEHAMKTDRKRWMNDERLGARYRELIRMRDGG
ncbi:MULTISPECIES: hypothetical protein [unclassified Pseudomonas]|uniref:hypothetical protein n=1 Tax=unclassified Pseudomonas TaxID=196821 RepID=UPI00224A7E46|nr:MULTISPECIES: hypothetical protein [unclassified Pseudomonas]MCX2815999.1 hypothetical protein [Pseudomonas sp. DCB_E]MCX9144472.1 hypothetical protein [Pseudomonas sp. DCB_Q]